MAKVYLSLYKGRKTIKTPKDLAFRIVEWVIRKVTGGQYSHCEIAVPVAFFRRPFLTAIHHLFVMAVCAVNVCRCLLKNGI